MHIVGQAGLRCLHIPGIVRGYWVEFSVDELPWAPLLHMEVQNIKALEESYDVNGHHTPVHDVSLAVFRSSDQVRLSSRHWKAICHQGQGVDDDKFCVLNNFEDLY